MAKEPKERVSVTLPPGLLERVDRVAEERGESRAVTMERMLGNSIDFEEKFLKDMENPLVRGLAKAVFASPQFLDAIAFVVRDQEMMGRGKELKEFGDEQLKRGTARKRKKKLS